MQNNPLTISLKRLSEGDSSQAPKVCRRLSNRLVLVPIVNQKNAESGDDSYRALVVEHDGRSVVPLFTHERLFKNWRGMAGETVSSLALLGSDFCAALNPQLTVLVDPGSAHVVELTHELIDKIAIFTLEEEAAKSSNAEPVPVEPTLPVSAPSLLVAPPRNPTRPDQRPNFIRPKRERKPTGSIVDLLKTNNR
jgi:hypothetical protein